MLYLVEDHYKCNNCKTADNIVDLLLKITTEQDIIHIIDSDMKNCITIGSMPFIGKITTGEVVVACAKHRGIYDEVVLEVLRPVAVKISQMVNTFGSCIYRQRWKISKIPLSIKEVI